MVVVVMYVAAWGTGAGDCFGEEAFDDDSSHDLRFKRYSCRQ